MFKPHLLAQESSSFSSFSALVSLRNTFFLNSSLLSLLVNSAYSSLISICVPSDTSPTRSFISNDHQMASSSTQPRLSRNSSSSIEVISSLTLRSTNRPVLLSSMKIIVNSMSGSNPKSGVGSLIPLF